MQIILAVPTSVWICLIVLCLVVGSALGYFIRFKTREKSLSKVKEEAEKILSEANAEAEKKKKELISDAKAEIAELKKEADLDVKERKSVVVELENKLPLNAGVSSIV